MRLICGVFRLDGADADEALLRKMAAQMSVPRLRPSLGVWCRGPVALGVLDFSRPGTVTLPERNGAVMAADVRLDAAAALACDLNEQAAADDALLLALLAREGSSALGRVLGDFAFASWNQHEATLTCARDGFGIRPLSYVHRPGRLFAFASLPQALHGSGLVAKRIDEAAVARRVALRFQLDDSLVAGIARLPPAHILSVSRDGISLRRYWQLDRAQVGTRRCPPEEAARELRRLVGQAVACRLPAGEIGAHLSGGLDSSAIAVLAARHLQADGRTLHAYSFLDRQRNDLVLEDETAFVKEVLKQEDNIDWTAIRPPIVQGTEVPIDIDKMTALDADEPEAKACAEAEAKGVGLILSGWGGDEAATFNGRGTFAELFLRGRWRNLAREVRALRRERGWSVWLILRNEVVSYLLPDRPVRAVKRLAGRAVPLHDRFLASLTPSVRRRLATLGTEELRRAPDGRENRWRLVTSPHVAERAEIWAQSGARHGLAFAFPLLDRRVVEFALSLPSSLFLRDGFRRRLFRDAMVDVLPEAIRLRHAKYYPFPGWVLDVAESRDVLLARIEAHTRDDNVRRVVDLELLHRQVEAFPTSDRLREEMRGGNNPTATALMVTALRALAAADYIAQHGGAAAP